MHAIQHVIKIVAVYGNKCFQIETGSPEAKEERCPGTRLLSDRTYPDHSNHPNHSIDIYTYSNKTIKNSILYFLKPGQKIFSSVFFQMSLKQLNVVKQMSKHLL